MKFKEFYYKLLSESPTNISNDDEYFSENVRASEMYEEIISSPEQYKKVFSLKGQYPINLYENQEDNDVMCYFLPTNGNDFIYGYVFYELRNDGGIITTSVYNNKKFVGLAYRVYDEYLIPKFGYVMSDGSHTERGRNFWRKIVRNNLGNACIWDYVKNEKVSDITSINDLEKYYGGGLDFGRFRVRIGR
jgi:hypothetical protein